MAVLRGTKRVKTLSLLIISSYFILFPPDLLAIHAIFKGSEAIPRKHGSVRLNMLFEEFIQAPKGLELPPAIGQFSDEHRFELDLSPFPDGITQVFADFYKDRLFRIEINYKPIESEGVPLQGLIDANTKLYGPPRVNSFTGTRLIFWDDGATRMILEVDKTDATLTHSLTYIDDDLFHQASRDRVQRETGGRANYGK